MNLPAVAFKMPHEAVGVDLGDSAVEFRADKTVFIRKSIGDHYTIQLDTPSGILDLHRTWQDESGRERHKTIFAIKSSDIPKLIQDSAPDAMNLFSFRRLRLGWLARNNIAIVKGLEMGTDEEIVQVTRRDRRKRLVLDETKFWQHLRIPEYLEEVWDFPNGTFSLVQRGRIIGLGIKVADRFGYRSLFWMKFKGLFHRSGANWERFAKVALQYAIPPTEYGDYEFLSH